MPNEYRQSLIQQLAARFGELRRLPGSNSLLGVGYDGAWIYLRYSRVHGRGVAFFGLRQVDLAQLDGHNSFICFFTDDGLPPLFVPHSDFERVVRQSPLAADGQYKAQVIAEGGTRELYIPRVGRFNIDGYGGIDALALRSILPGPQRVGRAQRQGECGGAPLVHRDTTPRSCRCADQPTRAPCCDRPRQRAMAGLGVPLPRLGSHGTCRLRTEVAARKASAKKRLTPSRATEKGLLLWPSYHRRKRLGCGKTRLAGLAPPMARDIIRLGGVDARMCLGPLGRLERLLRPDAWPGGQSRKSWLNRKRGPIPMSELIKALACIAALAGGSQAEEYKGAVVKGVEKGKFVFQVNGQDLSVSPGSTAFKTFDIDGKPLTEFPQNFWVMKAFDLGGRQLRGKGENLRVLKEGNQVDVTTFKARNVEVIREIHLVQGALQDKDK